MAILGLVVQKTDTVNGLGVRLIERFPDAQWSRSVAHNSLPSLEKQGLVRMVDRGAERALDRYEATDEGIGSSGSGCAHPPRHPSRYATRCTPNSSSPRSATYPT